MATKPLKRWKCLVSRTVKGVKKGGDQTITVALPDDQGPEIAAASAEMVAAVNIADGDWAYIVAQFCAYSVQPVEA